MIALVLGRTKRGGEEAVISAHGHSVCLRVPVLWVLLPYHVLLDIIDTIDVATARPYTLGSLPLTFLPTSSRYIFPASFKQNVTHP
jgi:hypothetical protein